MTKDNRGADAGGALAEELRGNLPLQYVDGPDYCTVTDATGGAFALTVQPELMKLMEQAALRTPALPAAGEAQTSPISQSDVEMLRHLADSMGFGRTHDMLQRVIAATPYLRSPAAGEVREVSLHALVQELFDFTTPVSDSEKFIALASMMAESGWWKRAEAALALPQSKEVREQDARERENHWRKLEGRDPLPASPVPLGEDGNSLTTLCRLSETRCKYPDCNCEKITRKRSHAAAPAGTVGGGAEQSS